jgi:hypothetical protein
MYPYLTISIGFSQSSVTVTSDLFIASRVGGWSADDVRRVYVNAYTEFQLEAHFETYAHVAGSKLCRHPELESS